MTTFRRLTALLGIALLGTTLQAQAEVKAFTGSSERAASRVFLYTEAGGFKPLGQMSIDYGPVTWKPEYATRVASPELDNIRWRLGKDFWTNLNNNVPVSIGNVRISAGHTYLTVVRRPGDKYFLEFNDPAKIRPLRLDAFQSASPLMPPAAFAIPLKHDVLDGDKLVKTLTIRFANAADDATKGELLIEFGNHRLSAPFQMHP